jgi:hypothetical protein
MRSSTLPLPMFQQVLHILTWIAQSFLATCLPAGLLCPPLLPGGSVQAGGGEEEAALQVGPRLLAAQEHVLVAGAPCHHLAGLLTGIIPTGHVKHV